jgi:hypothetical protein
MYQQKLPPILLHSGRIVRLIKYCCAIFTILATSNAALVAGYRLGDVVDTEIVIDGIQRSNPLRHQMPMFGAKWVPYVRFEKIHLTGRSGEDGGEVSRTFSLQFEDGLWVLPTISLVKEYMGQQPKFLDQFTVQFVFSKTGAGVIHAVSAKNAMYSTDHKSYFLVTYEWIEEEAVSPSTGLAVMFLFAFLLSVFSILFSCGIVDSDQDDTNAKQTSVNDSYQYSLSVPKHD